MSEDERPPEDLESTWSAERLDSVAPAPETIGAYRILRKVGEGGMAYVYAANEIGTDTLRAVKVLSPRLMNDATSTARLRREAELAQRLDHPNVCRILAFGETPEGLRYVVMPFLEGETLNDRETRDGAVPVPEGIALLLQMCSGLEHAHRLQILHRDLKPENVMLVPDETLPWGVRAVVTDFGLAKELEAGPEVHKLTSTGIVLGTPEFLSPEQVRGKPLDPRSDVFALGVLAFELLTGELPFVGDTAQDLMLARLQGEPRSMTSLLPSVPPGLEAVLAKALTRDPAGRYPTMDAFAQALAPHQPVGWPSSSMGTEAER